MAKKNNSASADSSKERVSTQDIARAPDMDERARLMARHVSQNFPLDRRQARELYDYQKWTEMLLALEDEAKLHALPDWTLRMWSEQCYNDWRILEGDAWDKLEGMSRKHHLLGQAR